MEEQKSNDIKNFIIIGGVVCSLVLIGLVIFLFFFPS